LAAGVGTISAGTLNLNGTRTFTVNDSTAVATDMAVSSVIANGSTGSGLTKAGAGTLALNGANTYTGATTVNAGSLFVNGSTASGSAVTVNNSGTTLGGSGTINGSINVASSGANLSPGASGVGSTAILYTGAVTLSLGSNFNVDLNNTTAGTGYDQLSVTGALNLGGLLASNLVVTAGSNLHIGDKFFILLNDSTDLVSGTFAQGTTITASNNGDVFQINYADNGDSGILGNDISLTVTAVPEPATYVVGILALCVLGYHQRPRLRKLLRN